MIVGVGVPNTNRISKAQKGGSFGPVPIFSIHRAGARRTVSRSARCSEHCFGNLLIRPSGKRAHIEHGELDFYAIGVKQDRALHRRRKPLCDCQGIGFRC